MGSEQYPYKGIIDHLANRGFSDGTNAWTATDHTAYTVNTAGEQGFLQILPIYVDHILYPTMTKAGFITEVCAKTTCHRRTYFLKNLLFRSTILTPKDKILALSTVKCRDEKILRPT
jgi:hypothetical protein